MASVTLTHWRDWVPTFGCLVSQPPRLRTTHEPRQGAGEGGIPPCLCVSFARAPGGQWKTGDLRTQSTKTIGMLKPRHLRRALRCAILVIIMESGKSFLVNRPFDFWEWLAQHVGPF